jgi:hypothetical protein
MKEVKDKLTAANTRLKTQQERLKNTKDATVKAKIQGAIDKLK